MATLPAQTRRFKLRSSAILCKNSSDLFPDTKGLSHMEIWKNAFLDFKKSSRKKQGDTDAGQRRHLGRSRASPIGDRQRCNHAPLIGFGLQTC